VSDFKRVQESDPFEALMMAAADAIIIIDDSGIIEQFNPAAERMFGFSKQEACGRNVSILMPEPQRSQHDGYIASYLQTGEGKVIGGGREVTGLRKNGDSFPMALSVGEIRQAEGQRFVGIVRDLSEFRAAQQQVRHLEEQLLHADRLVILGELTAGIAHEINQPLTAIAAYADAGRTMIDRREDTPREDMQSICARISEQSRRAAEVVQRLRKLVRSGTVSKTRQDIKKIINNVLLLFEYEIKNAKTDLHFEALCDLPPLYVDEVQIQQILVNLVKNSLDALSGAGVEDGAIAIQADLVDEEIVVSVSDNGPGVSIEDREKLFEAFFTTKPKGVGLGLSICKSIAAAHGGSLKFSAQEGGGSRFTLSLPLRSIG
jgi:two-component system sensor kinase FixL